MRALDDHFAGEGRLFLVAYDYVGSGKPQRCGFICRAANMRGAAESFWNQHPGEWFRLVSVSDGQVEAFWSASHQTFVTIPGE